MYSRYSRPKPHRRKRWFFLALVIVAAVLGVLLWRHSAHSQSGVTSSKQSTASTSQQSSAQGAAKPKTNYCTGNTLPNFVLVSVSKRHLWACDDATTEYGSAVVTGMENLPADLTPTGTYKIYAKQTSLYLNGSDSTGSWHDFVNYWMPFLSNQYGIYGFHDATWRKDSAFGNISPYSSNASHGCVELPLATAKWLYNWAPVGTTVTVKS